MSLVISKKNKFIFFHIPKNAGSSVGDLLIKNENFYYSKIIFSKILKKFSRKDNFFLIIIRKNFISLGVMKH